jgi:DNA invertase Pin-like site-specific DNA recombinase
MKIGYARTSTREQNLDLQLDAIKREGCEVIYTEQRSAVKERPELDKLMGSLRDGDILVVWKLDRLGRSLNHLIQILNVLKEKHVEFVSIQDKIDTSSAIGRFFFNVFASLSEFEREMIIERTNAGLMAARQRGRIGGRKQGLSQDSKNKAAAAKHLYCEKKLPINEITKTLSIGKSTLYRYLRYMNVEIGI